MSSHGGAWLCYPYFEAKRARPAEVSQRTRPLFPRTSQCHSSLHIVTSLRFSFMFSVVTICTGECSTSSTVSVTRVCLRVSPPRREKCLKILLFRVLLRLFFNFSPEECCQGQLMRSRHKFPHKLSKARAKFVVSFLFAAAKCYTFSANVEKKNNKYQICYVYAESD